MISETTNHLELRMYIQFEEVVLTNETNMYMTLYLDVLKNYRKTKSDQTVELFLTTKRRDIVERSKNQT